MLLQNRSFALAKFDKELTALINRHSLENGSDTPDFVLAEYLLHCLQAYNGAVRHREYLSKTQKQNGVSTIPQHTQPAICACGKLGTRMVGYDHWLCSECYAEFEEWCKRKQQAGA